MAALNGRIKVWEIPLNWIIVFFGNLSGALVYAILMGKPAARRSSGLTQPRHLLGTLHCSAAHRLHGEHCIEEGEPEVGCLCAPWHRL